ncbi:MAG: DNA-directed RNA polymerase subunit D [Crenarchaeota archaeon]|nr:DNA-directed RNA polymerase subunit D [Thermoproteota archaeon]
MARAVRLLEEEKYRLRMLVEGYPLPLVNAVRRACFTDVPVMAIDVVEFFENNTVLYDEIIAHRLGLIPLTSEEALEKYPPPEECRDAPVGDPRCYAVLSLEVHTSKTEPQRIVYSGDLQPQDPDVKPVYPNIPIVVMAPQQSLRLQAYARLGYGKEHAKWIPVTVAAHKYLPVLSFDLEKPGARECIECIEQAYPWLAEKMRKMGRGSIEVLEDVNTSALYWCVHRRCGEAAKLDYLQDRLILTIETTGSLTARRVLLKAVEAVEAKAKRLLEEVEALKTRNEQG